MHSHYIPTPHCVPSISVKSSAHGVSCINDNLSPNPTKASSHPSVVLTDTYHSSYSKREETFPKQQPSFDLSFGDYFCNYWRNTVADEQNESSSHFMNTVDAHRRDAWQDFLDYYASSRWQLPGVPRDWAYYDDLTWQLAGGWLQETRAQWRQGHVKSKVPKKIQVVGGGGRVDKGYSLGLDDSDDWKNDDDICVCAEGHADYGVIGEPSHKRRRNLPNEQDQRLRQLEPLTAKTYETQPTASHVTSTGFTLDHPLTDSSSFNAARSALHSGTGPKYPMRRPPMEINHEFYSCTSPSTLTPRTPPNHPVYADHILPDSSVSMYIPPTPSSIPRPVSCSSPVFDRNRKYSHNPSRITTPAPLEGSYQHLPSLSSHDPYLVPQREAHNAVAHTPRYRRLIGFFFVSNVTLGCGVGR